MGWRACSSRAAAFDKLPHSASASRVSKCRSSNAVEDMSQIHPLYEDNEFES
jgi:hypothetical protein